MLITTKHLPVFILLHLLIYLDEYHYLCCLLWSILLTDISDLLIIEWALKIISSSCVLRPNEVYRVITLERNSSDGSTFNPLLKVLEKCSFCSIAPQNIRLLLPCFITTRLKLDQKRSTCWTGSAQSSLYFSVEFKIMYAVLWRKKKLTLCSAVFYHASCYFKVESTSFPPYYKSKEKALWSKMSHFRGHSPVRMLPLNTILLISGRSFLLYYWLPRHLSSIARSPLANKVG